MKRILSLVAIIVMLFCLSACDLNPIINKINGNEAAAKAQQEKEKYTVLADGTYLYKQSSVSADTKLQFKDEEGNILIDSSDILYVSAKWSEYNNYYIELEFTKEGTADFARATRENINKTISIVLDEQILLAPTVVAEITSGNAIIDTYDSYDELISFFDKLVK